MQSNPSEDLPILLASTSHASQSSQDVPPETQTLELDVLMDEEMSDL
jgi:hypothetical protein